MARRERKYSSNKKTTISFKAKTSSVLLATAITSTCFAYGMVDSGEPGATATITAGLQAVVKAITQQYTRVTNAFDAQMAAMDAALASALKYENEQTSSAMKVFVKQMSVSANMVAENTVKLAQNEAAVEQALVQKEKIIETSEKLGPQGQGHKVCTVLAERDVASKAASSNQKSVPELVSTTLYSPPGGYGNPHTVQREMNDNHSTKYCTPEQASAGYCAASTSEAGWDLQMSTLFTPTTTDSSVYDAQNALINNMVGLPDAPLPEFLKGSPTASNYLILKQKKDAIISPAINSLKSIQAEFAGMKSTDSSTQISPIKAIDEQVKRYLGSGEEYQSWNKTLVSASEEGVMKELLQVLALDLYVQARQYKQYEREELLLAGIVSATQQLIDKKDGRNGVLSSSVDVEKQRQSARNITKKYFEQSFK